MGPFEHDIHAEKVPPDRAIAAIAEYGVVGKEELARIGVQRGSIAHRLQIGRLHLLHPRVYAVGHPTLSLEGRWRAAVLACGPGAVLSHRDAAHLWGLRRSGRRDIDVTAPGRSRHRRRGLTVHRPRSLPADDVTEHERIPVTAVPRTLLDLAEVLRPLQLRRAFEECDRLGLFDLKATHALLARSQGRRGLKPLIALLAEHAGAPHTKSDLEARLYDILREYGLPMPAFNAALHGYEVDALWPAARLVVELDSFEFHGKSKAQHERDRVKQLDLQVAGYTVLRYTWRMLDDGAAVAAQLRAFLEPATSRR